MNHILRKPGTGDDLDDGPRRRRATLRDVADAAGVSVMTVSNVVNNRFSMMSPDTRERVEREIRRLSYRPHAIGRSLRRSEALNIGFVILDEDPAFLRDPFITEVTAGLCNHLAERGYNLTLRGARAGDLGRKELFGAGGFDGVCAMLSGPTRQRRRSIAALASLGQPVVIIEEAAPSQFRNICSIRQDDFGGGRLVAEHLLERGAQRFIVLQPQVEWPAVVERVRGMEAALHGLPGVELLRLRCDQARLLTATKAALARHIEDHGLPDAVVAINDKMAIAAMQLLHERGIGIPNEVSVTGFNGFEFSLYVTPPLTTVVSPAYELGVSAGEELLHRLRSGEFRRREIVHPVAFRQGATS